MGEKIVVDPELLLEVSMKLGKVKTEVEEVVDALPYIKRMTWDTWGNDNTEKDIFADHCQALRDKSMTWMVHVEQRSKALQEASGIYDFVNQKTTDFVKKLDMEDIF